MTSRAVMPAVAALLILSACQQEPGPVVEPHRHPLVTATSPAGGGKALGRGTVTDTGEGPVLCVGAIEESAPPQCDGVRVVGLDVTSPSGAWNGEPGSGWSDELVLVGTYDGATLTLSEDPMFLGTFDPVIPLVPADPATMPPTALTDTELAALARDLQASPRAPAAAYVDHGHVAVEVAYDDGTLQDALDREHGRDVVVVRPVLVPLPEG